MQYANELYFGFIALTLFGLAFGGKSLISENTITKPENYWFLAIIITACGYVFFAVASTINLKLLTPANTFVLTGYLFFAAYCRSLNQAITKQLKWLMLLAVLLFALIFNYLLENGTFFQRVNLFVATACLLLTWQLFELKRLQQLQKNFPVFLVVTIIAELILLISRLILLFYLDHSHTINLYQEPVLSTAVRWFWVCFALLSYVAVISYKIEQVSTDSMKITLENNLIKTELAYKKIEQSELQMLKSLNALAMARDNETGNHILRTQHYVKVLALQLRNNDYHTESLSDSAIDLMFKAAPLHDIGKIGIPDHILHKKGPLTAEEWEIMKTHSSIGEQVLSSSELDVETDQDVLSVAVKIAGGHHEKWDGTGYPRGLVGDEIPLEARIMALADMYDALVSERVYKKAWTHEEAVKEISSKRETHLDPFIVDAFITEQNVFQEIAQKYRDS